MTDRELMQQALEALELYQSKSSVQMFDDTAKALRERLAQPNEFEPDWDQVEALQESLREHMAEIRRLRSVIEQAKEPVALEAVYQTIIHWDEGGGKRSRRELARRIVALYTAPLQRKPLTDEEIERACVPLGAAMLSFTEVARAIEAAHGIKGKA